ncbi:MAG: arginase family protein, partial [Chitinophagaceae bacterium]
MSDYLNIIDFLEPVNRDMLSDDKGYRNGQVGKMIALYEEVFPDLQNAHIVLVGCGEQRGAGLRGWSEAADAIRKEFYDLYYWHTNVPLADIGNIKEGNSLQDTYAALKTVIQELMNIGKLVVVLGGSHDLTL